MNLISEDKANDLRSRAELVVNELSELPNSIVSDLDALRIVHELQVHKIELEMQNEELNLAIAELTEHKEHLEKIIKNAPAGYFRINSEGYFLAVNDAWLKIHGYDSPDEVIGKHFSMMLTDSDLDSAVAHLAELKKGASIPYGEFSSRRKDGSVGYQIFSAHPVVHVGNIVGFEWFIIDISERRQLEEVQSYLLKISSLRW